MQTQGRRSTDQIEAERIKKQNDEYVRTQYNEDVMRMGFRVPMHECLTGGNPSPDQDPNDDGFSMTSKGARSHEIYDGVWHEKGSPYDIVYNGGKAHMVWTSSESNRPSGPWHKPEFTEARVKELLDFLVIKGKSTMVTFDWDLPEHIDPAVIEMILRVARGNPPDKPAYPCVIKFGPKVHGLLDAPDPQKYMGAESFTQKVRLRYAQGIGSDRDPMSALGLLKNKVLEGEDASRKNFQIIGDPLRYKGETGFEYNQAKDNFTNKSIPEADRKKLSNLDGEEFKKATTEQVQKIQGRVQALEGQISYLNQDVENLKAELAQAKNPKEVAAIKQKFDSVKGRRNMLISEMGNEAQKIVTDIGFLTGVQSASNQPIENTLLTKLNGELAKLNSLSTTAGNTRSIISDANPNKNIVTTLNESFNQAFEPRAKEMAQLEAQHQQQRGRR